ncbi:protein phosphatase 1 regulatory subunit 12B isoform X4 [Oncorhynchus mykiss]|uniref:protein phosphatase 1 regulatory subunit 12B isoform X4 n=1 Tax=Oncorhynchus mykiss TaxID=8022 RepID=UPI001878B92B|nr:protein phosphatase 1 regulatory subunit 12B isoform X4 [Oncorhynchus mykiss]
MGRIQSLSLSLSPFRPVPLFCPSPVLHYRSLSLFQSLPLSGSYPASPTAVSLHRSLTFSSLGPCKPACPVRDEEAESQRKARSRQARQTRRSTQGVTLAELKEAQRTNSLSPLDRDRQTADGHSRLTDRSCLRGKWAAEDRGETRTKLAQSMETEDHSPTWSREIDELGNHRSRLGTMEAEYSSASGHYTSLANRTSSRVVEWRDENQNPIEDPSKHVLSTIEKQVRFCDQESDEAYQKLEHDRASRLDSGGGDSRAEPLGRTSSYTRRETRLAALNKHEDDTSSRDYKKMYEDALAENDKLKSRLDDSKQELTKIRTQLDKVTQKQDRVSERSTVLESEKREKQALEKRVTDMEEELKQEAARVRNFRCGYQP